MTHCWLRRVVVCSFVLVGCLLAGCGPKEIRGAKLRGRLVKDGQPVGPQRGEQMLAVTFERVEPEGTQVIRSGGHVQKDGTFAIEGQMGKGTPPGKYMVWIHAEVVGDGESRFAHLFAGGKSPFLAEVTDQEDQLFVVDVGKKTVTKQ